MPKMTKNAGMVILASWSILLSGCTVYRFSLEPKPPDGGAVSTSLGEATFSFEYQSEYSRPANEPFFLERLEATLREFGEFKREASVDATQHHHLHVDVHRRFHGAAPQDWLTGLTLGLIPSTVRRETYLFHYAIYQDGALAGESRYSLWSRASSWIFLIPWGDLEESPTHYGRGTQLDFFQDCIRAFSADSFFSRSPEPSLRSSTQSVQTRLTAFTFHRLESAHCNTLFRAPGFIKSSFRR